MVPVYFLRLLSQSLFFLSQFIFVRIKLSFDTANKALLMYVYFIFWIHSTLSYVHNCLYLLLNCNSDPISFFLFVHYLLLLSSGFNC